MIEFLRNLFSADFMPHGHCFYWQPGILWLHVASDGLTALSYYIIPFGLIHLARHRRDLEYRWMLVLFGAFILSCGTTHLVSIVTMWNPMYRFEGVVKAITAASSLLTAMFLVRTLPEIRALPSPAQLRKANDLLAVEIEERRRAEAEIRRLNAELEDRVALRTGELMTANEQLRENEALLRQLIEAMPQLAWMATTDGKVDFYNHQWTDYTGCSFETLKGNGWVEVVHPEDREQTLRRWQDSVGSGGDYEVGYRLRRADGRYRWFLGRARPLYDSSREIRRWFGTCTDIDDQKAGAEELRLRNEDLNQFAYAASHDLQEPLRMISIYCELLDTRYGQELSGEAKQFLRFIIDGAHRMETLLHDLLDYARAGSNRDLPTREQVDSGAVLRKTLENLRASIEKEDAQVLTGPLPVVRMGEAHLLQLFQNLVSNAIKYRDAAPPRVEVFAHESSGEHIFCVRDNGPGIPPAYHDQVFGIFKRLHGREVPGTGIGLALCKKIVERYGGRIWVESEPGAGSTFCFTVPV